jgi:Fungal specific transcription factor domain
MIGLAARNAQRLGLHKDPSSFNYSQWVSEWRRRLWNQLILLDEKAIVLQGATSVLGFAWDTRLPGNSNDEAWNTSPSAKPSDAPKPTVAFSQMTFVLLKREILAVLCPLRRNLRTRSYEEQMRHIAIGHKKARALFAVITDDMFPLAAFVKNIMEIEFGFLQLMAGEALIRFGESLHTFKHE